MEVNYTIVIMITGIIHLGAKVVAMVCELLNCNDTIKHGNFVYKIDCY